MARWAAGILWVLVVSGAVNAPATPWCEPWSQPYAGEDATGSHVIAFWPFRQAEPLQDASGNGHELSLQGAEIVPDGRFEAALESFPGWPVQDQRHAARAAPDPALSPAAAFSLEMWIRPKPALDDDDQDAFLLDKKYVAHDDYQLILGPPDRSGNRVLRACLGFGQDSATWHAQAARFGPGEWYHVAFTYDGEGTGRFFLNGMPWGEGYQPGRREIHPGRHPLSIGDRIGSYYRGFPGYIDHVRIARGVREFRPLRWEVISDRRVFRRLEEAGPLQIRLTNLQRETVPAAEVRLSLDGVLDEQQTQIGPLEPGEMHILDYPLDTSLRPQSYAFTAQVTTSEPQDYAAEERFAIQIVPRPTPHRMPVLMWGIYGSVPDELARLKEIGFSHVLGIRADNSRIWEAGEVVPAGDADTVQRTREALDTALAHDLTLAAALSPGSSLRGQDAWSRVDRDGQPVTARRDICGLFPEIPPFCYNVGASIAQTYGDHPAWGAALLHTEVRDHARPCFHDHDYQAFREATGLEIPEEVDLSRGVLYSQLPDFPESRVIPDDHPLLVYYRWYWKQGDGWNALNTALHEGLRTTGREDVWTFHDPAVRVARVYGSGGNVDVLSQWTYSYPDPLRIGLATDELLAMAAGANPAQDVMKMTQIIWYRSQTAPEPRAGEQPLPFQAQWEREQPDAPFITIAPLHLRQAFWTKIARPIRGIMYHGWQSLVPVDSPSGYRYTNPQTQHELSRLIRTVVRPLGPTLLQVPGVSSDVALLQSFASEMFARRGTFGWGRGWIGDCYHVLLYASLQPRLVFDETILQNGLDGIRVLVLPDCDVLTEGVVQRIQAFQEAGGLVVGDPHLCPAIVPDVVLPAYQRTGDAEQDKRELQQRAAQLREALEGTYRHPVDSTNPDVVPYRRRWRDTDYVFAVNDHREFGDYVGHHRLVMENGLPSETQLRVVRDGGVVYDLVNQQRISTHQDGERLSFPVRLGPCDGGVYLVLDRPIDSLQIAPPQAAALGDRLQFQVEILDEDGTPVPAVVPIQLSIQDAAGREAEFSGYYGAVGGKLEVELDLATNESWGVWSIQARELASGQSNQAHFRVLGPESWPPGADDGS